MIINQSKLLEGKNVLIIGAGLIGKALVRDVIISGANVILADINIENCERIKSSLNHDELSRLRVDFLDITSAESYQNIIERFRTDGLHIDAVVNNAYPRNKNYGRLLENVSFDDFNENINLHLGGYFLSMQQFSKYFHAQGYGQIICISSIYGIIAPRFDVYQNTNMTMPVEYAATKSAIVHLTRYFMRYYKGTNIRFNCISPGGVEDNQSEIFQCNYNKYANSKGMLMPGDISGTLIFLLSDLSKFVNGQNIVVDDGWSI